MKAALFRRFIQVPTIASSWRAIAIATARVTDTITIATTQAKVTTTTDTIDPIPVTTGRRPTTTGRIPAIRSLDTTVTPATEATTSRRQDLDFITAARLKADSCRLYS